MPFVFAQACVPAVPVWGEKDRYFPIHRVYAIAGNYADHLAEMGRTEKTEAVFFTKPADGLIVCREGKSVDVPYPRETDSFCLEAELVVALLKKLKTTSSDMRPGSNSLAVISKKLHGKIVSHGKKPNVLTTLPS